MKYHIIIKHHQVILHIGVQSFFVGPTWEDKEQAGCHARMLSVALDRLIGPKKGVMAKNATRGNKKTAEHR